MQSEVGALLEATAGVVGSTMSTTILYPLDVVKTRMIAGGAQQSKGVISTLIDVVSQEGLGSMYGGLHIELIKASATNFIYFYVYTALKNVVLTGEMGKPKPAPSSPTPGGPNSSEPSASSQGNSDKNSSSSKKKKDEGAQLSVFTNLVIGCIAGSVTQVFLNPLNVVCTRMQVASKKTTDGQAALGVVDTFRKIYEEGGWDALYRGFMPSLVLSLNPSIQFLVFDQLKCWWLARKNRLARARVLAAQADTSYFPQVFPEVVHALTPMESMVFGALAKIAATYATYPLILAKVRMQVSTEKNGEGMLSIMWNVFKKEGVAGLYNGVSAQVTKSVLASALLFAIKEKLVEVATLFLIPAKSKSTTSAIASSSSSSSSSPSSSSLSGNNFIPDDSLMKNGKTQ